MTGPASICLFVLLSLPGGDADKDNVVGFSDLSIACPGDREHCLDLHVHITVTDKGPVQDAKWLRTQVGHANRLLGVISVGFRLASVKPLPTNTARTITRKDRDLLGRERWKRGAVSVFVVEYLANVDEEGQIYGVHWRDRKTTSHRWIILSSISWGFTLAHELGHFFGLKHCSYKGSIMNKTGKEKLPMSERGFVPEEIKTMRKRLKRMLKRKYLVPAEASQVGGPNRRTRVRGT